MTCLFTLIFSGVCNRVFQKLRDVCHCNRLSANEDGRIQLSSIKSDIKEIYKNIKLPLFSLNVLFWKA